MLARLTGYFSPYSLKKAVVAYDYAITNTLVKQLLVNIARAHIIKPTTLRAYTIFRFLPSREKTSRRVRKNIS
ncbi:MAG: hypothetical protein WD425_17745 [Nitrospirales bacterium]